MENEERTIEFSLPEDMEEQLDVLASKYPGKSREDILKALLQSGLDFAKRKRYGRFGEAY